MRNDIPPPSTETKLFMNFNTAVYNNFAKHADMIVDFIRKESLRHRIDPKYVFFTLNETQGKHKKDQALRLALELAIDRSDRMKYDNPIIPPLSKEKDVEKIIKAASRWANTTFLQTMKNVYRKTAVSFCYEAQKYLLVYHGKTLTNSQAANWLAVGFYKSLQEKPLYFYKQRWFLQLIQTILQSNR